MLHPAAPAPGSPWRSAIVAITPRSGAVARGAGATRRPAASIASVARSLWPVASVTSRAGPEREGVADAPPLPAVAAARRACRGRRRGWPAVSCRRPATPTSPPRPRPTSPPRSRPRCAGPPAPRVRPAAIVRRLAVKRRACAPRCTAARSAPSTRPGPQIGAAYAYGASGPRAFDCSGLTAWAMRRAGVSLPHSSFAQAGAGTRVARDADPGRRPRLLQHRRPRARRTSGSRRAATPSCRRRATA